MALHLEYLWGARSRNMRAYAYDSSGYPHLGIWQVLEGELDFTDLTTGATTKLTAGDAYLSYSTRPSRILNPGLASGKSARIRGCDCYVRLWNQIDLAQAMDWPILLRGRQAAALIRRALRLVAVQETLQDTIACAVDLQKAKTDLIDGLVALGPVNAFGRSLEQCDPRLRKVLAHMWNHRGRLLSNAELAKQAGLSESRFMAFFGATFSASPMQFHLNLRLAEGARLLRRSGMTLEEISAATGFHSAFHFSRRFSQRFGTSPSRYRHLHE